MLNFSTPPSKHGATFSATPLPWCDIPVLPSSKGWYCPDFGVLCRSLLYNNEFGSLREFGLAVQSVLKGTSGIARLRGLPVRVSESVEELKAAWRDRDSYVPGARCKHFGIAGADRAERARTQRAAESSSLRHLVDSVLSALGDATYTEMVAALSPLLRVRAAKSHVKRWRTSRESVVGRPQVSPPIQPISQPMEERKQLPHPHAVFTWFLEGHSVAEVQSVLGCTREDLTPYLDEFTRKYPSFKLR